VEKKSSYLVGMGQLLVEGGKPDANLTRASRMIQKAADAGCAVVVLPECLDIGWTSPMARELAAPVPGPHSDVLSFAAKDAGIYVVAGLTERDGDRIYNTAVLLSDEGTLLTKHRKINVLDIAQDLYSIGDRLSVVETPLGTIGIDICADNFGCSLVFAHAMARMGAQVILSPSAWAVAATHDNKETPYGGTWRIPYERITRLYDLYVAGVSNVGPVTGGPWDGQKCIGCSMAYGPGGEALASADYGDEAEQLVTFEVSPVERSVSGTSWHGHLQEKGYEGP
jgi:predicted amidohydrolase